MIRPRTQTAAAQALALVLSSLIVCLRNHEEPFLFGLDNRYIIKLSILFDLLQQQPDGDMNFKLFLSHLKVVCHGQEFEGSANDDEDRPLRCYTGALGGRIETTCEPEIKHCTIHITSE